MHGDGIGIREKRMPMLEPWTLKSYLLCLLFEEVDTVIMWKAEHLPHRASRVVILIVSSSLICVRALSCQSDLAVSSEPQVASHSG